MNRYNVIAYLLYVSVVLDLPNDLFLLVTLIEQLQEYLSLCTVVDPRPIVLVSVSE